jgi:hypothetical protein
MDHLPEQHRLPGLRGGVRWVSTPDCRQARAVSTPPWDRVDHVVHYLFAGPADLPGADAEATPAGSAGPMDSFFALGAALAAAGRIPQRLPPVHLGGFVLEEAVAAPAAQVDAAVVPWRPHRGVYLVLDGAGRPPGSLDAVVEIAGVAGAWRWRAVPSLHPRFDDLGAVHLSVVYLEDDPCRSAEALGRWAISTATAPLLGAPMCTVVPFEWEDRLP